ncbi:MAG: helix-turn-helix domain-containing protein [Rhodanobacter sp.]|nr:MAG: helix-turn-helix domain-containing protein [Rhodanobacter sp.]
MTTMQPHSIEQGKSNPDLFGINLVNVDMPQTDPHTVSFGNRLHAARETQGLSLEACAQTLKLPARILRQLERDEYDGIDSKIYLGSYIGKYGHYLGIDEALIQVELDRIKQIESPLVTTGGISHSRFLLDRYVTAITYTVLTAVIVVPMIWLGVRGTLDRDISHLAPLDASPVAQPMKLVAQNRHILAPVAVAKAQQPKSPPSEQPLMASMAPFPDMEGTTTASPAPPAVHAADHGAAGLSLNLSLSAASWVEVVERDGTRLEYGLLPASSNKTYQSDQPLDVRIGNVDGAQLTVDGQPLALDGLRHANVAHFRVQLQDGKVSTASL